MGLQCSRRAPRRPTELELLQLHKMEFLLRRPFSATAEPDVEKLKYLWDFFQLVDDSPEVKQDAVDDTSSSGPPDDGFRPVSAAWKQIGFQQENPLRDIRSGGTLAMCNFDYFCRSYPEKVREMCSGQQKVRIASKYRRGYPFATASINITRLICVLFNLVNKYGTRQAYDVIKLPYWTMVLGPDVDPLSSVRVGQQTSGDSPEQLHLRQHINESLRPVHELYCTAFVLLDREFRN